MYKKLLGGSGIAVALALALVGGASTAASAPAKHTITNGGTITLSSFAGPASINPMTVQDVPGFDLDSLMYDGLIVSGPNLSAQPDLATHWTVSPNGLVYTFYLNPKAKWSDGQPVTSQDVVWTYEQYANPLNANPGQSNYTPIKKYIAVNPHEVQFVLSQPYGPFLLNSASGNVLPYHILKNIKPGKAMQNAPQLTQVPMIGSGPFIMTKIASGNYYQFKANPNYFLGASHVSTLIYKIVPDENTGVAQLKTGAVDYAAVPPQDATVVQHSSGLQTKIYASLAYTYIGYNMKDPIFANPLTRQAMAFAINRAQIVKSVVDGYGYVANGIVPPISWAYDKHLAPMGYSPAHAKDLLKQAGWKMGPGGVLVNAKGQKLEFTLMTNSGNPVREQIGTIVQQELGQIGIKVKFSALDFSSFLNNYLFKGKYQAYILGWSLAADPDQSTIFESTEFPPNGQNFTFYKDPIVDHWTKVELTSGNQAVRANAMIHIQAQMQKDQPYTFLYFPKSIIGMTARFHGFTPNPSIDFYQPYKWWASK